MSDTPDTAVMQDDALLPAYLDPVHHAPLQTGADGASLIEPVSGAVYQIENGIADLVHPRPRADDPELPRFDRPLYAVEEAFLKWTFRAFGSDEAELRARVVDKLDLAPDAVVLDNACGTGANTRLLQARLPRGILYNTDLSMELLAHGADRLAAEGPGTGCRTIWCGANALYLPFADKSFDAVLSTGGFNQFGDPVRAIAEMTRVTRTGGRIVIVDEGYAPWLRPTLTGQMVVNDNPLMAYDPPIAALPDVAQEVRVEWMLGNAYYCLDFRVGAAPSPVDLDLPHEGLRGGTIRSRFAAAQQRRAAEADR
ncbi:class I SAM-dependent methyltransferase [Rhodobacter maris]|uniref:Methyltransferase family protein n=1 Tax=Rhodobacter maris TaxID=446682 RepID=A0A285T2E9_9RHOB|nr:methyltransferase domain-containing protein [Rhodobacter maris]SOC15208.1 methyltransferase family protein [Rhodobacter maris]